MLVHVGCRNSREIGTGSLRSNFNNDSVMHWTLASQVLYRQIPFSCFGPLSHFIFRSCPVTSHRVTCPWQQGFLAALQTHLTFPQLPSRLPDLEKIPERRWLFCTLRHVSGNSIKTWSPGLSFQGSLAPGSLSAFESAGLEERGLHRGPAFLADVCTRKTPS